MVMAAMVGPEGCAYAFGPFDANAELLERSIQENRFADRIDFHRRAGWRRTATLTFPA